MVWLGLVGVGVSCGQHPAASSQQPETGQRPASQPASPTQPSPALHHLHHHLFVSRLVSRLSSLSPPLDLGLPPIARSCFCDSIHCIDCLPTNHGRARARERKVPICPARLLLPCVKKKKQERKKKRSWELKGVINPSSGGSPHIFTTPARNVLLHQTTTSIAKLLYLDP